MRKKWIFPLIQRRLIIIILIIIQLVFFVDFVTQSTEWISWISYLFKGITFIICIKIIASDDKPEYKLTWVFCLLLVPLFGGLFYLLLHVQSRYGRFHKRLDKIENETQTLFKTNDNCFQDISAEDKHKSVLPQIKYLNNFLGFPAYKNTRATYFKSGTEFYEHLLSELAKAKKYIFIEYFIIQQGIMWDSILKILEQKVSEGVTVRVMYDDVGCFLLLPKNYDVLLKSKGIDCINFNPFKPAISSFQNNRDHRKILSIDGKIAYTGGINLADEYINEADRFGQWKDSAVALRGDAAWSLTLIFLQLWNASLKTADRNVLAFKPDYETISNADGVFIPYADNPLDKEDVSEQVYLNLIHNAHDYLYINTPYLIINDKLSGALIGAAKSGVDVKIVTPHIFDKKFVSMATKSYYRHLIKGGVKIYEYSKGFNHAKSFVSDDSVAVVGTVNLDYRSLYLHFECAVWFYDCNAVLDVKKDFVDTLPDCIEITKEACHERAAVRLIQDVLRVFAPLL